MSHVTCHIDLKHHQSHDFFLNFSQQSSQIEVQKVQVQSCCLRAMQPLRCSPKGTSTPPASLPILYHTASIWGCTLRDTSSVTTPARHMQRQPPSIAQPGAGSSICATSNAILALCLSCPTGVQPFVPLASPLLRAHGDVLELDALCKQHASLSRQVGL